LFSEEVLDNDNEIHSTDDVAREEIETFQKVIVELLVLQLLLDFVEKVQLIERRIGNHLVLESLLLATLSRLTNGTLRGGRGENEN
jgi:hypothetical protein